LQLQNYEEIKGVLNKINFDKNQGIVTLEFTFKKKINLPINVCDKDILVSSLGKKIAVLRIDDDLKIRAINDDEVWIFLLKTVGCKVPAELYFKINKELYKIGKNKSEFLRMLIDDYFKNSCLVEKNMVNRLTTPVNQFSNEDEYQDTIKEVDGFLKSLNTDIKKTKVLK